jgi:hypothetical protein
MISLQIEDGFESVGLNMGFVPQPTPPYDTMVSDRPSPTQLIALSTPTQPFTHNPNSGQNAINTAPSSSQKFALNDFSRKGLMGKTSVETFFLHPLILARGGDR